MAKSSSFYADKYLEVYSNFHKSCCPTNTSLFVLKLVSFPCWLTKLIPFLTAEMDSQTWLYSSLSLSHLSSDISLAYISINIKVPSISTLSPPINQELFNNLIFWASFTLPSAALFTSLTLKFVSYLGYVPRYCTAWNFIV